MTPVRLALWSSLAALFCAGLVAALASGTAAGETAALTATTTSTTTATAEEQPTLPQSTVLETTVQQTVTNTHVITKAPTTVVVTTSTETDTSSGTKTWALVVIGIAIVGLVVLIGWLASRHKDLPPATRRRMLAEAVAAWVAQGWAPVSQTESTAVLRRGDEHTVLSVDGRGNISSQAVRPDAPSA